MAEDLSCKAGKCSAPVTVKMISKHLPSTTAHLDRKPLGQTFRVKEMVTGCQSVRPPHVHVHHFTANVANPRSCRSQGCRRLGGMLMLVACGGSPLRDDDWFHTDRAIAEVLLGGFRIRHRQWLVIIVSVGRGKLFERGKSCQLRYRGSDIRGLYPFRQAGISKGVSVAGPSLKTGTHKKAGPNRSCAYRRIICSICQKTNNQTHSIKILVRMPAQANSLDHTYCCFRGRRHCLGRRRHLLKIAG